MRTVWAAPDSSQNQTPYGGVTGVSPVPPGGNARRSPKKLDTRIALHILDFVC
jgi:hypothetical protein